MRRAARSERWFGLLLAAVLGLVFLCPGNALAEPTVTAGAGAADASRAVTQTYVSGVSNFDYARDVLARVNSERAAAGLAPLALDAELTNAAMLRAGETSVLFSHSRPNGTPCFDVSDKAYGENIAMGYRTPAAVMQGWMSSPGHRANILGSDYRSVGIGCVNVGGSYYWVQLFGYDSAEGTIPTGSYSVTMPVLGIVTVGYGETNVMQRLYNSYTGEHFYTANVTETYGLIAVGWRYEGVGWTAPASGDPVYRLYNPYVTGGDHHYTLSEAERDSLVAAGWRYEGVGWMSADAATGVPLYRQYNPYATTGTHNYTTSKAENDHLVSVGWREEGVGWYGV